MVRNAKLLRFYDFSGGVNVFDSPDQIKDNECSADYISYDGTQNVYWDRGLKKRLGTEALNATELTHGSSVSDTGAGGIRWYFTSSAGVATQKTIAAFDNGTNVKIYDAGYTMTEITGGTAIPTGAKCEFASWKNKLYIATNGKTVLQVITESSGSYSKADISGLTAKPKTICVHKDRLWANNDTVGQLECTDYDDATTWGSTNGEYFNTNYGDGNEITRLLPLGDDLIIYKWDSIWKLEGDNLYNWFERTSQRTIGAIAGASVADIGGAHIFLSEDNVYLFDGSNLVPIGNHILPFLEKSNITLKANATACYHNGFYKMAFTSDTSSYNDLEFWFDVNQYKTTTDNDNGSQLCWWLMNSRNIQTYIPYTGPADVGEIYMVDAAKGYVRQMDTGYDDDGTAYTAKITTKFYSADNELVEKQWDILKLDFWDGVGSFWMYGYNGINKQYTFQEYITTNEIVEEWATSGGGTWGGGSIWGGAGEMLRYRSEHFMPCDMDGRTMAVSIQHDDDTRFKFFGFEISFAYRQF